MKTINTKPLSHGVRQALRDSKESTYQIGADAKVSAQNLYRFLDENGHRVLSQKSIDSLGLRLELKLTYGGKSLQ